MDRKYLESFSSELAGIVKLLLIAGATTFLLNLYELFLVALILAFVLQGIVVMILLVLEAHSDAE